MGASLSHRNQPHKESVGTATVARRAPADVRLPCMLYAAVGALSRDFGSDTELAIALMRKTHGVLHVVSYEGAWGDPLQKALTGIAVVTRGYWFSRQTLARLMAQCGGALGMFAWDSELETAQADARVTRGTAQFVDGRLHLWLASVDAPRSRAHAARIAGISQDLVDLRVIGQPQSEAGRNVLVSAIALARALQPAPVQVIVAQEFEHRAEAPAARAAASAMPLGTGALRMAATKELAA